MKILLILTSILLVYSCNSNSEPNSKISETEIFTNFDWLLGKWKRSNEQIGKETFENWNKLSANEYVGVSCTIKNNDTIWQENMQILKQRDAWVLLVKSPSDSDFFAFPMVEIKNQEFTSKNDTLDFPKEIKYWKNRDQLNAHVAGDSTKIDFVFEPIQ